MKTSRYNRYIEVGSQLFVYNLLSRATICIDDQRWGDLLRNGDLEEFDDDEITELKRNHIVCDEQTDEYLEVLRLQRTIKYGNRNARITILPTLNCNFSCWYCYESHRNKNLTKQECDSIKLFCDDVITHNKLNTLTLDWFGGEPMLEFHRVIVPLSLYAKRLCDENSVEFVNMITTNGFLVKRAYLEDLRRIGLNRYQITLDGGKEYHNRTRFSNLHDNSYDRIIDNICLLVTELQQADVTVRINCTIENIDSLTSIIESFPQGVRSRITISFQPVWQRIESLKEANASKKIARTAQEFLSAGFLVPSCSEIPPTPNLCYVENMLHFTIAPNLEVYKCTARDFIPESSNHIGHLTDDGRFVSNDNIVKYYCNSFFENDKCSKCEVMPVCRGNCIQKCTEGVCLNCQKESLIAGIDSVLKERFSKLVNKQ